MSAQASLLPGNRLHLNHGPIDLVISADGVAREVERAYAQAAAVFPNILPELVAELPLLRMPLGIFASPLTLSLSHVGRGNAVSDTELKAPLPSWERGWGEGGRGTALAKPNAVGPVAKRMVNAAWPYRDVFITPMAAVAGAVAEHVLAAMIEVADLRRAIVNNGGDIALHLATGERMRAGVAGVLALPRLDATIEIDAADPVRGMATSGWRGRSQSLGIADAVTVLAQSAAMADAAATMIANAVNVDDPAIHRLPACKVRDDSDLGAIPVTVGVGPLSAAKVRSALENGARRAAELKDKSLIVAAYLQLQGQMLAIGGAERITAGRAA
jgi:ApbE superfamily uncharacterized protein (UPF0280 family)